MRRLIVGLLAIVTVWMLHPPASAPDLAEAVVRAAHGPGAPDGTEPEQLGASELVEESSSEEGEDADDGLDEIVLPAHARAGQQAVARGTQSQPRGSVGTRSPITDVFRPPETQA